MCSAATLSNCIQQTRTSSVLVLLDKLGIGLLVHELLDVLGVLDADLEDPAIILGLAVDQGGVALNVLVVGDNFSGHGGVDVGGSLHRLNATDAVSLEEAGADLSDLQVNYVAELALSEVCDANLGLLQTHSGFREIFPNPLAPSHLPWCQCCTQSTRGPG